MYRYYLLICIFGVLATRTVAREAIRGDNETYIGDFPYIVSLLEVDSGHICGGVIIGEWHILTAARCFINPDNSFKSKKVFALMGTSDIMRMTPPAFNTEVVKVYALNEFHSGDINSTGDIAVLKVKDSIPIGHFSDLHHVRLEKNQKDNHTGKKATIAGWGWNTVQQDQGKVIGSRTDAQLRSATADVLSHHQCREEHPAINISEDHLCAKIEQREHEIRGVCYGDEGGPLVENGFVIGVLSGFPKSCTESIRSAIYTRVSHYLTFITNSRKDRLTKNIRVHVLGS